MTLKDFFIKYPKIAIAFSGGTDSAYLCYMAKKYAKEMTAIYVSTAFQPTFEKEDAIRFCKEYAIPLTILERDVLSQEAVIQLSLIHISSSGAYSIGQEANLADRIRHLIMPMAVVILEHLWYYAYMIRNRLLEETRRDYVLLCKAKGMSRGQIMRRHCLRNIMPTYISLMAISVPHILGGTYIVETVF